MFRNGEDETRFRNQVFCLGGGGWERVMHCNTYADMEGSVAEEIPVRSLWTPPTSPA